MSEFKNVTVVKKANVYFDGKVTSRSVIFADGSKKTLGVATPAGGLTSARSCAHTSTDRLPLFPTCPLYPTSNVLL